MKMPIRAMKKMEDLVVVKEIDKIKMVILTQRFAALRKLKVKQLRLVS